MIQARKTYNAQYHVLRPLETFNLSRPFFALKSSSADSAFACTAFGAILAPCLCQKARSPPIIMISCGAKYTTAATMHFANRPSIRNESGLGELTVANVRGVALIEVG